MRREFLLAILLVLCQVSDRVEAQAGAAAAVVADKIVGSLIEDASNQAKSLLLSAQHNANASIARLANELNVAAENMRIALSADLDRRYDQLSRENQKLLDRLNVVLDESRRIQIGIIDLKDSAVLDLADIMDDTWLSSGRVPFFVQRIDGIVQLQKPSGADYVIGVLGLGFGPSASDRISEVEWVKLGTELVSLRQNRPRAHYTEFTVPNRLLEPHFRQKQLTTIPFQVGVVVRTQRFLSSVVGLREERHFVTLNLSLLSRYAGHIAVYAEAPTEEWTTQEDAKYTTTSPDVGDSGRWHAFAAETKVNQDRRFVAPVSYTHSGPGCPWTKDWKVDIAEEGRALKLSGAIQGASCNHTYGARLQARGAGPNAKHTAEFDLEYEKLITIDLPIGTKFWKVQGISATMRPIEIVKCTQDGNLRCEDDSEVGGVRKVTYRVLPPIGLTQ